MYEIPNTGSSKKKNELEGKEREGRGGGGGGGGGWGLGGKKLHNYFRQIFMQTTNIWTRRLIPYLMETDSS
jgi:hypothetical protein